MSNSKLSIDEMKGKGMYPPTRAILEGLNKTQLLGANLWYLAGAIRACAKFPYASCLLRDEIHPEWQDLDACGLVDAITSTVPMTNDSIGLLGALAIPMSEPNPCRDKEAVVEWAEEQLQVSDIEWTELPTCDADFPIWRVPLNKIYARYQKRRASTPQVEGDKKKESHPASVEGPEDPAPSTCAELPPIPPADDRMKAWMANAFAEASQFMTDDVQKLDEELPEINADELIRKFSDDVAQLASLTKMSRYAHLITTALHRERLALSASRVDLIGYDDMAKQRARTAFLRMLADAPASMGVGNYIIHITDLAQDFFHRYPDMYKQLATTDAAVDPLEFHEKLNNFFMDAILASGNCSSEAPSKELPIDKNELLDNIRSIVRVDVPIQRQLDRVLETVQEISAWVVSGSGNVLGVAHVNRKEPTDTMVSDSPRMHTRGDSAPTWKELLQESNSSLDFSEGTDDGSSDPQPPERPSTSRVPRTFAGWRVETAQMRKKASQVREEEEVELDFVLP